MKIAVAGLGFMGSTHLKGLKNIPAAELVAVVDGDETRLTGDLSGIQGNIGGPGEKLDFSGIRKYRTIAEAARDPDIELIDICLPTHHHADATVEALRAGKHVMVEKPMALDGAQADAMLAEARKSGRMLMVAQVLRFIPDYRVSADLLHAGGLGGVRSAIFRRRCAAPGWSRWLSNAAQSGGGVFDLLIHDIDFALWAFGPPEAISATGYEDAPRGIDFILAHLHYPDIPTVVVSGGWHHPKAYPFSMEFTIVTDGATLEFSSEEKPLTIFGADGEQRPGISPDNPAPKDAWQAELEYFIDCVSKGRQPEVCPPDQSAAAVKLARMMVESRSRNGERIQCKL
jgi:predicted dehydrogenase